MPECFADWGPLLEARLRKQAAREYIHVLRLYTHLGGGDMRAVYESQSHGDSQVFVDRALEVIARGHTAIKVLLTPPTEPLNSIAAYKFAERTMAAIRTAVGDDVDVMVDCHGRHSLGNAVEFCRVLAPYRPLFVQEQHAHND